MTTIGSKVTGRALLGLMAAALAGSAGGGCYIAADTSQPCDPNGRIDTGFDAGVFIPPTGPSAGRDAGSPYTDAGLPRTSTPPAACSDGTVTVDRFKELMIIEPVVLADPRADNSADNHPWSFRQRLEDLNADPAAAGPLADAWLEQWKSLTAVPVSTDPGAATIPITARPTVDTELRCAWRQTVYENYCDVACGQCPGGHRVDMARAPFRLLAIANRIDLASAGACGNDGGELRFVYGAVGMPSGLALPLTVIFEYHVTLRPGESLRDWAAAWHALGTRTTGFDLANALEPVVAQGMARATLRRVLTNDGAFGPPLGLPWEMRQFVPAATDDGVTRLVEVTMAHTPRLTLASSKELGQWIDANAASVLAGDNKLDARFLASSAPIPSPDFAWKTMASDPAVNAAFNRNTCNGCHGGRTADDIPFQHVSAPVSGYYDGSGTGVRLSKVLHNPGHDDELGKRERALAAALCGRCAAGGADAGY